MRCRRALQQALKATRRAIDWQSVAAITHAPRGMPVPVTGGDGSIEAVLAAAPRSRTAFRRVPNWDGGDDTGTRWHSSAKQLLLGARTTPTALGAACARGRRIETPMAQLSEWLQIMLAEIAPQAGRKRGARPEEQQRRDELHRQRSRHARRKPSQPDTQVQAPPAAKRARRRKPLCYIAIGFEGRAWPSWLFPALDTATTDSAAGGDRTCRDRRHRLHRPGAQGSGQSAGRDLPASTITSACSAACGSPRRCRMRSSSISRMAAANASWCGSATAAVRRRCACRAGAGAR